MNKYSEAYSSKGFNEEQAKTAAQVEIKHLIKNGLEQIWFQELEHNVVANRFELMNKLLEKYLNICILDPEKGFDPNRLFYRKKTAKPDLFPHLRKPNISVDQLSSGMRNLFNLIMALGNTDSKGPLFIDEPEISLHMDWEYGLKDIATLLADSTKRQIIFSTHSPDLIMNFGERSIAFISESEHDGI
jgi:predicted ATP-dependent endonuclease of OLD family